MDKSQSGNLRKESPSQTSLNERLYLTTAGELDVAVKDPGSDNKGEGNKGEGNNGKVEDDLNSGEVSRSFSKSVTAYEVRRVSSVPMDEVKKGTDE